MFALVAWHSPTVLQYNGIIVRFRRDAVVVGNPAPFVVCKSFHINFNSAIQKTSWHPSEKSSDCFDRNVGTLAVGKKIQLMNLETGFAVLYEALFSEILLASFMFSSKGTWFCMMLKNRSPNI